MMLTPSLRHRNKGFQKGSTMPPFRVLNDKGTANQELACPLRSLGPQSPRRRPITMGPREQESSQDPSASFSGDRSWGLCHRVATLPGTCARAAPPLGSIHCDPQTVLTYGTSFCGYRKQFLNLSVLLHGYGWPRDPGTSGGWDFGLPSGQETLLMIEWTRVGHQNLV